MRKITPILCIISWAILFSNYLTAQTTVGIIRTIAGGGSSTADGIPATNAQFTTTAGTWTDAAGNIYVSDEQGYKIRKINAISGMIYTVAGNGTSGFSGDGGPAVSAQIDSTRSIRVDTAGNLYLGDYGNKRIRVVNAITGIITTIAGGGTSYADGIPATNARLDFLGFTIDNAGNIYTYGDSKVRKVNAATGMIQTIAGGGSSLADGVPATAALIERPRYMLTDPAGNLYLLDFPADRLRKIDATSGIITTVAGGGTLTADSIPATAFTFHDFQCFAIDPAGNIVLMDKTYGKLRRIDATTGIMHIIAGAGSSTADGIPATAANLNSYYWVHIDPAGNMYVTNWHFGTPYVRKINDFPPLSGPAGDSFSVSVIRQCNGPKLILTTPHYISGRTIKTDFGDGTFDSSIIGTGYIGGGYAIINHTYPSAGAYTIRHILYNGTAAEDTLSYIYHYLFCRTLPVKMYFEGNGNCTKETSETFISLPSVTEVDSNGITVETLSATSGFHYNAYGVPGDIYSFRLISPPGNMVTTCPSGTGIIYDTLSSAVNNYPDKYFGLTCPGIPGHDLSVYAVVPVTGTRDQWGHIFIQNNNCDATSATLTFSFSPKWNSYSGDPAPATVSGNTATYNIGTISANDPAPVDLYYVLYSSSPLTIGDTVQGHLSVTPISGDVNPGNNAVEIVNVIRAGMDPNEILVAPKDCIASGVTKLQYTIHFENTGNDTAHNIYVMDTLSDKVDPKSLRLIMASATMNITMIKDGGLNVVKFDFPKIKLLDSSHHGKCDGSVIFNINLKPGLTNGTMIENHAGIFFDHNPVVITNTVVNTIGCPPLEVPSVHENAAITVFPNPANDELTIKTGELAYTSFIITNTVGQAMIEDKLNAPQTKVNIKQLPAGIYYISVKGEYGNTVKKFVKM